MIKRTSTIRNMEMYSYLLAIEFALTSVRILLFMLISVLAIIFLLLLMFVVLLVVIGRVVIVFTIVFAFVLSIFTNNCIRVRFSVCVLLITILLVCGIDANIKICINSNMDHNTTTSPNIYTNIFKVILVLVLVSVTLSASD